MVKTYMGTAQGPPPLLFPNYIRLDADIIQDLKNLRDKYRARAEFVQNTWRPQDEPPCYLPKPLDPSFIPASMKFNISSLPSGTDSLFSHCVSSFSSTANRSNQRDHTLPSMSPLVCAEQALQQVSQRSNQPSSSQNSLWRNLQMGCWSKTTLTWCGTRESKRTSWRLLPHTILSLWKQNELTRLGLLHWRLEDSSKVAQGDYIGSRRFGQSSNHWSLPRWSCGSCGAAASRPKSGSSCQKELSARNCWVELHWQQS